MMPRQQREAVAVLGALYQGYHALYAVLRRAGAVEPGAVVELVRASIGSDALAPGVSDELEIMAAQLARIDNGGRPTFEVIDGGRQPPPA